MERIKKILTKSIHGIGMIAALLTVLSVFIGESFKTEELSVLLVLVTVIAIYAAFNILFNKNRAIKNSSSVGSGSFIFGLSMIAFCGICVRALAFMLLDVDVMGWRALIAYIHSVICFVFIYVIGRLSQDHRSGLVSSVLYVLLSSFDVYCVLENIKNGHPKTDLVIEYAGVLFILLSYIFVLLALKARTSKSATALFVISGVVMGVCLMSSKNAVLAAVCMMLTIALCKAEYRYVGKQTMSSCLYRSVKGVLLFFAGFVLSGAAVIGVAKFLGADALIPEWVVVVKNFDNVNSIFVYADSAIEKLWSGIYFERNRFITYVSILTYIFTLVMCSAGCMSSAHKKTSKLLPAVLYPMLLTIAGIAENGDVSYISSAVPFILILAGCGVVDSVNIVYLRNGGLSENQLPVPDDINEKDIARIEEKYNLPKGCVGVSVVSGDDESCDSDFDEEYDDVFDDESDEDPEEHGEDETDTTPATSGVASGDDLDNMLDDLFGTNYEDDEDDFSISPSERYKNASDEPDSDEIQDGVVIFKNVIK